MNAGERLRTLSGLSGVSAAAHLRAIAAAGATAGAMLVAYSQLPSATAAQHLLVDRAQVEQTAGGGAKGYGLRKAALEAVRAADRETELFDIALAIILSGALD